MTRTRRVLRSLSRRVDLRTRFNDLSHWPPEERRRKSHIVQFYSAVDNIGNYLPVLGIQKMLGCTPDTWNVHDRSIDFDFINTHYRCAIIGGAGLLHSCFDAFWSGFADRCTIPFAIWGVGVCQPDEDRQRGAGVSVVNAVAARAALVNVRDRLTADLYGLADAQVSLCPTVAFIKYLGITAYASRKHVLFSSHEELVAARETTRIRQILAGTGRPIAYTNNIQTRVMGIERIVRKYYAPSEAVVTTRLHGAILSYALGIPYVAVSRDRKLDAFVQEYGNGILVRELDDIGPALERLKDLRMTAAAVQPVLDFGARAAGWAASSLH